MTDQEQIYIEELAKSTLAEWLASPEFETRASMDTVKETTALGSQLLRAHGSDYTKLSKLWRDVVLCWRRKGWVTYEENTFGPKSFGTDDPVVSKKAEMMERRGRRRDGRPFADATERWISAMTGTTVKQRFVWLAVNYQPLVELYSEEFGPKIHCMTRAAICQEYKLPPKLAGLIVTRLVDAGTHKEVRTRLADGTRERQVRLI